MVKRNLGLDEERQWVITSEINLVDWNDPGIVPVQPGQWTYGVIPPALAKSIHKKVWDRLTAKQLGWIDRPKIVRRKMDREDR